MEMLPDDPGYLKSYIKEHPNNKMAWYLLGRQYMAKGEVGKANYCFIQAGEVYQAFEEGTVFGKPDDPALAEQRADERKKTNRAESRRRMRKIAILALLLALGSHIPLQPDRLTSEASGVQTGGQIESADEGDIAASGIPFAESFDVVYALPGDAETSRTNRIGELLGRFQDQTRNKAETLLLADPDRSADNKWLLWPAPAKPIAEAERSDTAAGTRVTYYDAKTCRCEPADAAAPSSRYAKWQNVQLQRLIVRSAVTAYETANGKPPERLEQLVRDYPDNWLSGYTPAMASYFDEWIGGRGGKAPDASNGRQNDSAEDGQTSGSALLSPEAALQEPMRILIDKSTHTLALVSGNVLLRSYPVGLGGSRTPTGEFTITEKVRNPNGRTNGTFGSRGMTLSDTLYAIHGTDQPSSIGKDKSLGCIRMLKPDIEELFDLVSKGTKVVIGERLPVPEGTYRAEIPLRLPSAIDETNPHKTYKWLD